jgi:hypothetical protein
MTALAAIVNTIEDAVAGYGLHLTTMSLTPDTLHAWLKAAPHEEYYGHPTA